MKKRTRTIKLKRFVVHCDFSTFQIIQPHLIKKMPFVEVNMYSLCQVCMCVCVFRALICHIHYLVFKAFFFWISNGTERSYWLMSEIAFVVYWTSCVLTNFSFQRKHTPHSITELKRQFAHSFSPLFKWKQTRVSIVIRIWATSLR